MKLRLLLVTPLLFSSIAMASPEKKAAETKTKTIDVKIEATGMKPQSVEVEKGTHLVLNVTRTTDSTCTKELKMPGSKDVTQLPLNKAVKFDVGQLDKSGEVKLLCGMGMETGIVKVN